MSECDGNAQEIFNFHGFTERGYTSLSPNSDVWSDSKEDIFFSDTQDLRQTDQIRKLDHEVSAPFMPSPSENEQEWCERGSSVSDEIFFVFGKPLLSKRQSMFDECQAAAGESAMSLYLCVLRQMHSQVFSLLKQQLYQEMILYVCYYI